MLQGEFGASRWALVLRSTSMCVDAYTHRHTIVHNYMHTHTRTRTRRVCGCECDVSSPESVTALGDFAKKNLGTVDIWINNAGRLVS